MHVANSRLVGTLIVTMGATLVLAACSSSGRYRFAGVGNPPPGASSSSTSSGGTSTSSGGTSTSSGGTSTSSGGTSTSSGGTSSSSGGQGSLTANEVIVAAGNAVIGLGGKHNEIAGVVNGALPGAQPITGTVTRVLTGTGQAVVDIGKGRSVVLSGIDSRLGDLVTLDLGGTALIGRNGTPLIGVSVLSPGQANGRAITVGLAGAGSLANIDLGLKNGTGGLLGGVTGGTAGVLGGVTGTVGGVVNTVTGGTAGGGLLGGVTGGTAGGGVLGSVTGGTVGGVVGGVTGGTGGGGLLPGVTTTVGNVLGSTGLLGGGLTGGLLSSK